MCPPGDSAGNRSRSRQSTTTRVVKDRPAGVRRRHGTSRGAAPPHQTMSSSEATTRAGTDSTPAGSDSAARAGSSTTPVRSVIVGERHLVGLELPEVDGLQRVEVLGEQEGPGGQRPVLLPCDGLPELPRDLHPAVDEVVVAQHRPAEDADPQPVDGDRLVERVLQPSPHAVPGRLVERVELRGDVGEEERVGVGLRGLRGRAPREVGAASEVPPVEPVVGVQLLADLRVGRHPRVEAEVVAALEASHRGAVDVPRDPPGQASRGAHGEREVRVGDHRVAVDLDRVVHQVGGERRDRDRGRQEVLVVARRPAAAAASPPPPRRG